MNAEPLVAPLPYLDVSGDHAEHRIYPLSSGLKTVRPPQRYQDVVITDARELVPAPEVSRAGFECLHHVSALSDFYNNEQVVKHYYTEVAELLKSTLPLLDVVVFDHNQRSAERASAGQHGVRTPVEAAHVDYTPGSGPRRAREILAEAGKLNYQHHHLALINVWRPIVGPVQDFPLAICDPRTAEPGDYVETDIHHFGEEDLETPRHSGQIYSLRYAEDHVWYYVSNMQPDEVLLLRNWDSHDSGHHGFAAHTGFRNPHSPADATPRESIEVRTLVIFAG